MPSGTCTAATGYGLIEPERLLLSGSTNFCVISEGEIIHAALRSCAGFESPKYDISKSYEECDLRPEAFV